MKLNINIIPSEIIAQYTLSDISIDGWVYCEIKKGMNGLPHSGKISNEQLTKHLAPFGYEQTHAGIVNTSYKTDVLHLSR